MKSIGLPLSHLREDFAEQGPVRRVAIQQLQDALADRFVAKSRVVGRRHGQSPRPSSNWQKSGPSVGHVPVKPRHFDQLRGGNVRLSLKEMLHDRIVRGKRHVAFRRRKQKAARVVERIAGRRAESAVPHQLAQEHGVDDQRRAALIARSGAVRTHLVVVLNPNRDGLRVAKPVRRGMATGARVVPTERMNLVEPEKPPEIGQLAD